MGDLTLYHGSPRQLSALEPRPARGVGPERDTLHALYASHSRAFAIAFALPIEPDEAGHLSWTLDMLADGPRIRIVAGRLDLAGFGYLYRVPAASFTQIDEWQWVSTAPVAPLGYEVIAPAAYRHWLARDAKGMLR